MNQPTTRDSTPGASDCLRDEVLEDLIEGRLSKEALLQAHRHAAECPACRQLLVELSHGLDPVQQDSRATPAAPFEPAEAGAWSPPGQFEQFRIERLIGRGGMGVVYLAHDTSLGRQVAVKFIALSNPEPWVLESFKTEARMIASLQHPNVVNVFSVGEVAGHPYIVSEYVVGQSLAELPLPVPWRRVLTLGRGLARGLAAAHRQGVLHRDIKPSNALETEDGEVKLLDFGLAERFEPGGRSSPTTLIAGTPAYMAPEVLARAPATPRSDIYSLGLVLRELYTGEVPGGPPASVEPGQGIDPDFAAIIARCLAPNPLERFASAEALADALESLQRGPPLAGDGNPYRGLAPFEAEHSALFFGRNADIRAVLERLRHRPLVLVAGDSGAGKSSLCRAGVLPRVAAGELKDGCEYTPLTLWPGLRPLEVLAATLAPVLGYKEAQLVTALADPKPWLGQALREKYQTGRGLLLFVDQLEELITLSEPTQAAHFARILGEFALPSARVRVLLAVRGDFLTRLCALPGLGEEAERALYILRPMSPDGVREAIVGPARSREVIFESQELIRTLVASATHGAGSLPLLQFALAELWERRDAAQRRITQAALDQMGGVAGALSRHADGLLTRLGAPEREAARRVLLQLVTGEDTRVERSEEELTGVSDQSVSMASRGALRALVDGRLLHARTAGGLPRYEITHDSLIQSWGTLRTWLDDDIGHRAVHKRLVDASAEWERLEHAPELLWGQRQLDEARPLMSSPLAPREHAFLRASRRAITRQRRGRWLAVLVAGLTATSAYGIPRLQAYRENTRFIVAQLGAAQQVLTEGRDLAQKAGERSAAAMDLFDGKPPSPAGAENSQGPQERLREAERQWSEALKLRAQADATYDRANQTLERALDRDRNHGDTRKLLAEVAYERVILAERFHQQRERDEHWQRLEQLAEAGGEAKELLNRLTASAVLELVTEPAGAQVTIKRYTESNGTLRLDPVKLDPSPDDKPLSRVTLPEGSYLLRFTHQGRAPVNLPLLLTHGTQEHLSLTLPVSVPEGYAYVPPGCFLLGSAVAEEVRQTLTCAPLHRVCLSQGYLIGKTEVTVGDWLDYLDSLPPEAPARAILEQPRFSPPGAVALRHQPDGGWSYSFYRSPNYFVTAKEGELFHYKHRPRRNTADWHRFPLSGVSTEDLADYFTWLDRTGRLPGARLCNQNEWEYAARGADGRRFPHGEDLHFDEANIDTTYNQQTTDFGPDEVGAHPASVSPFGLLDVAGNVYELTRAVNHGYASIISRGGAFYNDAFSAYSANIMAADPVQRDAAIGVRVCASFSPQ